MRCASYGQSGSFSPIVAIRSNSTPKLRPGVAEDSQPLATR